MENSVLIEDHFSFPQSMPEKSILTTSTPFKLSNLTIKDNEFAWKGSLESLKLFVQSDLNIEGQWLSPGGDVKQFVSKDYAMKWYGKKRQKLVIIRDDVTESLRQKLDKFATLNTVNDRDGEQYKEAEGDLNLGEVTEKSLSDDDTHEALKLQQKDYQVCLDLNKQNNKSTELPNNQQIAQENSKRKQYKEHKEHKVNSSNSNLLNTENRFQALSNVLDNQTQTETMTKNHQKDNEEKITNEQNECTAQIQNRQQIPKHQNRHNHKIGSDVIVIGDSIIKNIQPRKLTKKKVHKYTFPGKTADEIEKEINLDSLKAIPSHVIIHAGTNNLPTESVTVCANKIEKLAAKVKNQFPYSKIGLSGLTVRHDIDVSKKIVDVNKELGLICTKLNISFIDNSTIDDTCLNKSRLHLNEKGSAILAVHFITFLRGDRASLTPKKQRHEDFQQSAIQKLGELLKMIATPDKNVRRRKYYPT